ncbi:hypothetical protein [Aliagarivorans taiwanensis]|uniref:hypothetical protein n=1 Tax=Aliagarivorans taiwanensis TaxID=561966 RepID=UPI0003FB1039|nr:hypothetical protein [Aliagarivorans taiwanensis]
MPSFTRTYVHQYGSWWSFSRSQWRAFVERIIASGHHNYVGFDLPTERELSRRPRQMVSWDGDGRFISTRCCDQVVAPVDWEYADWQRQLEELNTGEALL